MRVRSRSPRRALRPSARHVLGVASASLALLASLLVATPAAAVSPSAGAGASSALAGASVADTGIAKAAAVVGFDPENIISDALFYDGSSMTAAEIQAFLDAKIGTCTNGKCLNVLSAGISSRDALYSQTTGNLICGAISGGTMKVSELIYRVQVACGISAKVILVTLQKEQGLTTSKAPSDWNLTAAMGASCPDTAPCDPAFAGVGPQILKGAQQLKTYKAANFAKQPGTHYIAYSPTASCGGTNVRVQNYATAALYNYTPYQPNAAALAAGFGLGDACSSYGNRNFYNYYTSWFGSTQASVDPCKAPASSATVVADGEYTTTTGLNARSAPTTECYNILTTLPTGTVVTRTATYGTWWYVRVDGVMYWVSSDYLTPAPAVPYTTSRLAGVSRYDTAVEVSKAAYPSGASTVLIASGTEFPDALAAGAAAGYTKAALLLTETTQIPASVLSEIVRLKATRVVVIGGADRVGPAVEAAIAAAVPGVQIERIAGVDRYDTSRLIAARFFPKATSAYLVTGTGYADAVVAAALGGARGMPVLLVDGSASSVGAETLTRLRSGGTTSVTIAGTASSVSTGIEESLQSAGVTVNRLGGVDRYETSRLLNVDAYQSGANGALFATGTGFADALTGSVLAAATASPLFTTQAQCMTNSAKSWMLTAGVTKVTLIGGTPSLSDAVAASVRC